MSRIVAGLLLVSGTFLFSVPSRSAGALPPTPRDAVAYQIDVAHDGHLVDPAFDLPLTRAWSVHLNHPSYPIIAQGLVIVTSRATAGGYGTRITAIDSAAGTVAWTHRLDGTYWWSNAAYESGNVFVENYDGKVSAFDAATGAPLWSVQLPGQWAFTSPPTVANGVIYASGSGDGGTVYAIDEQRGEVLWSQSVTNGDNSSPALSSTDVFVSSSCPQSWALSRADGSTLWHYSGACDDSGGKTVAYHHGRVYVRDVFRSVKDGLILKSANGEAAGAFTAERIPAFAGDTGYFMHGGTLRARSLPDLKTDWSFAPGDLSTAPIVVNGWVFVGSRSGTIYARRKATGKGAWRADVGARIPAPDERNVGSPLTGLGAGDGMLVVPAFNQVVAFS